MKTSTILGSTLIALSSLAAGHAFADSLDRNYPITPQVLSTVTRAQVRAETELAAKNGELTALGNDKNYPVIRNSMPVKTKADVRAELEQAVRDNTVPKYHS
jgi:hypothetical protein